MYVAVALEPSHLVWRPMNSPFAPEQIFFGANGLRAAEDSD